MIVIAILGILLAIAIPAYQDYTVRTKVSECLNLQAPIKLQISEFTISNGSMPPTTSVSVNRTTKFCDAGSYTRNNVNQGTITVNPNETGVGLATATPTIVPLLSGRRCANGDVEWSCTYGTGDGFQGRYLPASCRNSAPVFPTTCP
jgi:Tfp pilus assembly major pilin PilA